MEVVMAYFMLLSQNIPGATEKNHENLRTASLWAKIWTWDIPNTKQECHPSAVTCDKHLQKHVFVSNDAVNL
jgi:hypothetical protein